MSFIPSGIAAASILVVLIYPLDKSRMEDINKQLKEIRK
jgi:GPH family glycoside/pentoside/hexuronide:cation symporter